MGEEDRGVDHDLDELMDAVRRGRVPVTRRTVAIALLLHGGRAIDPRPTRLRDVSYLRMLPFANAIRAYGRLRIAPVLVHNTHGGWVGASGSGIVQARELVRALNAETGRPIVLVGHSSGGWAALRAGDEESVLGSVALAPWVSDRESPQRLRGKRIRVIHGDRDLICSPVKAREFVEQLQDAGGDAIFTAVPGGGHAMLDRPWRWHALAARAVVEIVRGDQPDDYGE